MVGDGPGHFQEHQLVQIAIEYFSRKETDMDEKQKSALSKIRDPVNQHLLEKALGVNNAQPTFSNEEV